jgi:hypothetical protein
VPLPKPVPGLVIRYSYLWWQQQVTGAEEGRKDRPCAIVAAVQVDGEGSINTLVLPITHSPPEKSETALEIPAVTKARLGLDAARLWILIDEWNEFVWPGPDLRRVSGDDNRSVAYGILPPAFFTELSGKFLRFRAENRAQRVERTE